MLLVVLKPDVVFRILVYCDNANLIKFTIIYLYFLVAFIFFSCPQ